MGFRTSTKPNSLSVSISRKKPTASNVAMKFLKSITQRQVYHFEYKCSGVNAAKNSAQMGVYI